MHPLRYLGTWCVLRNVIRKQEVISHNALVMKQQSSIQCNIISRTSHRSYSSNTDDPSPVPLRSMKAKAEGTSQLAFIDVRQVRTVGGNGGDGAISFLQLWANDRAGPDGGDGGSGGHVIFEATTDVKDLVGISTLIQAEHGVRGSSKDCFGKNAEHTIIKVPIGTIVRNPEGKIVADLDQQGMMFIAARGGAGGHGNAFFTSDTEQSPKICEYGAIGEKTQYLLEVRSMAHVGLIGLPNAGKSTLLRAISRARPKVASYPFTTLKPHLGMVLYNDYEQIAVADLPGLIPDSHKNKGLGVTFLKHAERCAALLYIVDISLDEPWTHLDILRYEIRQFSEKLLQRPSIVIANKIDLPEAQENLKSFKEKVDLPVIPISAKVGSNLSTLLKEVRVLYDDLTINSKEELQTPT